MADRSQGTFTIVYPLNTASGAPGQGYGTRIRLQTTTTFTIGDYILASLSPRITDGYAVTDVIVQAQSAVLGASRLTDLVWGVDELNFGVPMAVPLAGPASAYAATVDRLVDARFTYFLGDNTLVDDEVFDTCFTHDPLSQAGANAAAILWRQANDNFQVLQFAAPPAFITLGFANTGRTGTGSLALNTDALGVRITLTTIPGYLGVEAGNPNVLFDAGWINWSRSGAVRHREWITAAVWESFFGWPVTADHINYSLRPGVVATIQQLERG